MAKPNWTISTGASLRTLWRRLSQRALRSSRVDRARRRHGAIPLRESPGMGFLKCFTATEVRTFRLSSFGKSLAASSSRRLACPKIRTRRITPTNCQSRRHGLISRWNGPLPLASHPSPSNAKKRGRRPRFSRRLFETSLTEARPRSLAEPGWPVQELRDPSAAISASS